MRSTQCLQLLPAWTWKDCCGYVAGKRGSGPRTSDVGRRTSYQEADDQSLKYNARSLTSEGRRPRSEVRSLEQVLRVTDLLLQSGGFGLVAIDLGDVPHSAARRMPLASWFRFQRAVEPTPTVLLVVAQEPCAQTCASLLIRLQSGKKLSALSYQISVNSDFARLIANFWMDCILKESCCVRAYNENQHNRSLQYSPPKLREASYTELYCRSED